MKEETPIAVLEKIVENYKSWIANSDRMIELLQPEWDLFEVRSGHNLYVSRAYAEEISNRRRNVKELAAVEAGLAALKAQESGY